MSVVETQITDPDLDFEEPRVAHYVKEKDVLPGYVNGDAIEAICGKWFVPTRDPKQFPVCEACKEELVRRDNSDDEG